MPLAMTSRKAKPAGARELAKPGVSLASEYGKNDLVQRRLDVSLALGVNKYRHLSHGSVTHGMFANCEACLKEFEDMHT